MSDSYNRVVDITTTRVVAATTGQAFQPLALAAGMHHAPPMTPNATTSLGALASAHPAAARVFLRHRLDFCCGGQRSLADACRTAGLDPGAILDELAREAGGAARAVRRCTCRCA